MSAYVVENETINRVISAIINSPLTTYRWPLGNLGYNLDTETDRQRLCHDMTALNVKAVRDRYENDEQDDVSDLYRYKMELSLNPVQPYKSLECYLYQCNEGDNDKTPLFKALEVVKARMAAKIISSMPAYEAAEWA